MNDKLRIDLQTGLMIESVHPSQVGDDIIEVPCLIPYCLPRWTGTEWIEGATQEYIDSFKNETVEKKPIEERVDTIEQDQNKIIDLLAVGLGVQL